MEKALAEIGRLPLAEVILLAELAAAMKAETRERRLATMVKGERCRGVFLVKQAARMKERRKRIDG